MEENKEIMVNEDVMETVEDIANDGSSKVLAIAAGVALAVGAGVLLYKKVIKPAIKRHKAEKEIDEAIDQVNHCNEDDDEV